eukprot:2810901-Heterocapsa_arctica.AAC.1
MQKDDRPDEPELLQFDYSFLRRGDKDVPVPILIGIARRSGYSFPTVVRRKGASNIGVIGDVLSFLKETGLTGQVRIRTDSESSIKALMAQ